MHIADKLNYRTRWTVRRYLNDAAYARGECYLESVIDGNVLLNAGITEALNLIGGISATAFANANARIGVGDDTTAEAASQTGLIAATNKAYAGMEASYPEVAAQKITWHAVFGSSEANYAWREFVVDDGAGTPIALNRKVSDQGTKASGQTWTCGVEITLG